MPVNPRDPVEWAKVKREKIVEAQQMREEKKKQELDAKKREQLERKEYLEAKAKGYAAVHVGGGSASSNGTNVGAGHEAAPSSKQESKQDRRLRIVSAAARASADDSPLAGQPTPPHQFSAGPPKTPPLVSKPQAPGVGAAQAGAKPANGASPAQAEHAAKPAGVRPLQRAASEGRGSGGRLDAVAAMMGALGGADGGPASGGGGGGGNVGGKHKVVGEVQRIAKQRELRRLKQEEEYRRKQEVLQTADGDEAAVARMEFVRMIEQLQAGIRDNFDKQRPKVRAGHEHAKVRVMVRKRPLNAREQARKAFDIAMIIEANELVIVHEPKLKVDLSKFIVNHEFMFDKAFSEFTDNETVYRHSVEPLVSYTLDGGWTTAFAYGQTGSGKTHTISSFYARAAEDLFHGLADISTEREPVYVGVSFFEIYNGKALDLLNSKKRVEVQEDAKGQVQIVGLREINVLNANEVMVAVDHGLRERSTGSTTANADSSRSHAIFQLILRKGSLLGPVHGKLSLVDLAGSERGAETGERDQKTRMESADINKSLLALKECIRALDSGSQHVPFRGSKLTQVLRDSFIGERSRTVLLSMISPGSDSADHTLNTMRYADRVKEIGRGLAPMCDDIEIPAHAPVPMPTPMLPHMDGGGNKGAGGAAAASPLNAAVVTHEGGHGRLSAGGGASAVDAAGLPKGKPGLTPPIRTRAQSVGNSREIAGPRWWEATIQAEGESRSARSSPQACDLSPPPFHGSPALSPGVSPLTSAHHPHRKLGGDTSDSDAGSNEGEGSGAGPSRLRNVRHCRQLSMEEDIVTAHGACLADSKRMEAEEERMLECAEGDVFNAIRMEEYADRLEEILRAKLDTCSTLLDKVLVFKKRLSREHKAGR